jgi:hypothetical protein
LHQARGDVMHSLTGLRFVLLITVWAASSPSSAAAQATPALPSPLSLGDVNVEPVPATGAKYQLPRTALDFHPSWSPNGKVYVPGALRRVVAVSMRTQPVVTFGDPVDLPNGPLPALLSVETRGYDVLPDGRFLSLVPAPDQTSSGAAIAPELRVALNWFEELKRMVPTR